MVNLSQPQSSLISPVFLNEAPMTTVLMPKNLQQLQISVTDCTPGSSAGLSQVLLSYFLFQSRILPTNGEMRKSLLSAQATAWILWKTKVILHLILFLSRASPALMPSQVEASLIKMRSVLTPACSYNAMILLARLMDSFLLKDSRASTSVETKPLIFSSNLMPNETQRWSKMSQMSSNCCSSDSSCQLAGWASTFFLDRECVPQYGSQNFSPNSMELIRMFSKSGFLATWRIRVGFVVESSGWYFSIRLKSPVSATTRLCRLSWSNQDQSTFMSLRGEPSTGQRGAYMVGKIL